MNNQLDEYWHKIDVFQKNVLRKDYPKLYLKQSFSLCNTLKSPESFNGEISTEDIFSFTNYEVKGNPFFIHFTSLSSLSKILQSGFLRMSDFNCLSDETELIFSSELITQLSEKQRLKIINEKPKIFSLSACLSNETTLKNEHMWNHYASGGSGCAIEYQFNEMDIHRMIFGKVQYGKVALKPLRRIVKNNEDFKNEYNLTIEDFPMFLLKISAFHKDIKFKQEEEVRLLFHKDGSMGFNAFFNIEYKDFYTDNEVRNFIKIPLLNKKDLNYNNPINFPSIKISRVIIGHNNPDPDATISQLLEIIKETKISFEIWLLTKSAKLVKVI